MNVRGRQSGSAGRKMSRSHLANANGLTMEELAVARGVLNGMADGVTKIEGCPNSIYIVRDDPHNFVGVILLALVANVGKCPLNNVV